MSPLGFSVPCCENLDKSRMVHCELKLLSSSLYILRVFSYIFPPNKHYTSVSCDEETSSGPDNILCTAPVRGQLIRCLIALQSPVRSHRSCSFRGGGGTTLVFSVTCVPVLSLMVVLSFMTCCC